MALFNAMNTVNNGGGKLNKKHLTEYEYKKWLDIGEIDMRQNWLELFSGYLVDDIGEIIRGSSDNQEKQARIKKLIRPMGFEDVGLGTNVYTMANRHYPGVAFKIALDANGLADNFNDVILRPMVNECLARHGIKLAPGYEKYNRVLDRHHTGIVSAQDRKPMIISQSRMDTFRADILRTLDILADEFLIIDLSPSEYHFNYGVNRDGTWCFIDASDIYPIGHLKNGIRCTSIVGYSDAKDRAVKCGAPLQYSKDFTQIKCPKCNKLYFPAELRPKDKGGKSMKKTSDGMTADECEAMRVRQIDAMRKNGSDATRRLFSPTAATQNGRRVAAASTATRIPRTPLFQRPRTVYYSPEAAETAWPLKDDDTEVPHPEVTHDSMVVPVNTIGYADSVRVMSFDSEGNIIEDDSDASSVEYPTVTEPMDDPHTVDAIGDDDGSEVTDTGEPEYDEPVESGLSYRIVPVDTDIPGEVPGIKIKLIGDVSTALERDLLPIYVEGSDGIEVLAVTVDLQSREILKALSDQ